MTSSSQNLSFTEKLASRLSDKLAPKSQKAPRLDPAKPLEVLRNLQKSGKWIHKTDRIEKLLKACALDDQAMLAPLFDIEYMAETALNTLSMVLDDTKHNAVLW